MHKFKKKLFYGIFNNNNTNIISSCMDSVLDAESKMSLKPVMSMKQRQAKMNMNNADESNMSFLDDDSMMMTAKSKGNANNNETDNEDGETMNLNTNNFDECSLDNSNLPGIFIFI